VNNYHIMLSRRTEEAFAPLVSFTFIVIAFPYKHIRNEKEKITNMNRELVTTEKSFTTLIFL